MLNLLPDSAESKLQADPRPCRRPLPKLAPKFPKIHHFSDFTKREAQNHEMWSNAWPRGSIVMHFGTIGMTFLMIWDTTLTAGNAVLFFCCFWMHLGVVDVQNNMIFIVWNTHCPLWWKVIFRIHF